MTFFQTAKFYIPAESILLRWRKLYNNIYRPTRHTYHAGIRIGKRYKAHVKVRREMRNVHNILAANWREREKLFIYNM